MIFFLLFWFFELNIEKKIYTFYSEDLNHVQNEPTASLDLKDFKELKSDYQLLAPQDFFFEIEINQNSKTLVLSLKFYFNKLNFRLIR